jgi:hypothetical protein
MGRLAETLAGAAAPAYLRAVSTVDDAIAADRLGRDIATGLVTRIANTDQRCS